jgi:hypothetical protein
MTRPISKSTGSGPNLGHWLSRIRATPSMLRLAQAAQDCTATSSGSLSHCSVLNLVRSGSKAEMELAEVSFPQRVGWDYVWEGCGCIKIF